MLGLIDGRVLGGETKSALTLFTKRVCSGVGSDTLTVFPLFLALALVKLAPSVGFLKISSELFRRPALSISVMVGLIVSMYGLSSHWKVTMIQCCVELGSAVRKNVGRDILDIAGMHLMYVRK